MMTDPDKKRMDYEYLGMIMIMIMTNLVTWRIWVLAIAS